MEESEKEEEMRNKREKRNKRERNKKEKASKERRGSDSSSLHIQQPLKCHRTQSLRYKTQVNCVTSEELPKWRLYRADLRLTF